MGIHCLLAQVLVSLNFASPVSAAGLGRAVPLKMAATPGPALIVPVQNVLSDKLTQLPEDLSAVDIVATPLQLSSPEAQEPPTVPFGQDPSIPVIPVPVQTPTTREALRSGTEILSQTHDVKEQRAVLEDLYSGAQTSAKSWGASKPIELLDLKRPPERFRGSLREDYSKIVKALKPGKVISYSGRTYTLQDFLGEGGTTRIFAISNNKAIRIGKAAVDRKLMGEFVTMHKTLAQAGRSVVKVYHRESRPEFNYAIVERLHPQFNLSDFAYRTQKPSSLPGIVIKPGRLAAVRADVDKVIAGLKKFVQDMAPFSRIGDYHGGQVIWDGNRFVLVDWAHNEVTLAKAPKGYSMVIVDLDGRPSITRETIRELKALLIQSRRSAI